MNKVSQAKSPRRKLTPAATPSPRKRSSSAPLPDTPLPTRSRSSGELGLIAIAGIVTQLGLAVTVTALLFTYGGHVLDEHLGTSPWLFLVGIVLGFIASMFVVYRIVAPIREMLDR